MIILERNWWTDNIFFPFVVIKREPPSKQILLMSFACIQKWLIKSPIWQDGVWKDWWMKRPARQQQRFCWTRPEFTTNCEILCGKLLAVLYVSRALISSAPEIGSSELNCVGPSHSSPESTLYGKRPRAKSWSARQQLRSTHTHTPTHLLRMWR